jgi:6-phosphogluconolactonase
MSNFHLVQFQNDVELAQAAASAWLDEIKLSARAGKSHCVALSGGRITQRFFASVVELARVQAVPFNQVHFFWADERCVPPTDAESNFRAARELLFAPLDVSENQIHRIRGEDSPETAAKLAEAEIRRIVPLDEDGLAVLDLVLLGLGEDGHVASLFPTEPEETAVKHAIFRAVLNSPKPPPQRVTIGYDVIAAARQVWMLASGRGKETALRDSLRIGGQTPFARVIELRQQTKIFTDIVVK